MDIEKTINAKPFSESAKEQWYLSVPATSIKETISVQFNDKVTYEYIGNSNVNIGDPVIIDFGGATSYKMGNVIDKEAGITINKNYALKPLFSFTTNPDKKTIKKNSSNINWIDNVEDALDLSPYKKKEDIYKNIHVVDCLVNSVLNAISVIAFPSLTDQKTFEMAKDFLATDKSIPALIFGEDYAFSYPFTYPGYEFYVAVIFSGFYPEWKDDLLKCEFLKDPIFKKYKIEQGWDDKNKAYYLYFESRNRIASFFSKNEEFKTFTNELIMRSALSILIRGGFTNLLEAALSVDMPIKGFYDKLKDFAKEIGSTNCLEVLNKIDYKNLTFEKPKDKAKSSVSNNMKIEENVLLKCKNTKETLVIPDGIKKIGKSVFANHKELKKVILPNSITRIESEAFNECINLEEINFGKNITSLGTCCFLFCKNLKMIDLSNTKIKKLTGYCFGSCSKLEEVILPKTLIEIEKNTFSKCTNLKRIVLPTSIEKIDEFAFSNCSSLQNIEIPNSVTQIGTRAFEYCSGLTSIEIPNSVKKIGHIAFLECTSLQSLTINGATEVEENSFEGCTSLQSIKITKDVTSIGHGVRLACANVQSIIVEMGNTKYDSRNNCNAIIETETSTLINGCCNTKIPSDVTSIGDYAFYGCSGLTSIEIPNSVTSIEKSAFCDCSGLTRIEMPNSVTSIGNYAFSGCSRLTSIKIPDSVTDIGYGAFNGCSGLTSIKIPEGVTSIGKSAFSRCSGLTSIEIPDSVTSIGEEAFYGCSGLTSIEIPNSVTSIGEEAFYGCSGLTSIEIPNSVTIIERKVFYSSGLTSIEIPNSVTSIRNYAFSGCSRLTSIKIPDSVTDIGYGAFNDCSGLTSIEIPDSVKSIGENAFYGCSGLKILTIPSKLNPKIETLPENCKIIRK